MDYVLRYCQCSNNSRLAAAQSRQIVFTATELLLITNTLSEGSAVAAGSTHR